MTIEKYDPSCHAGATPEARISNRLRNSGEGAKPKHIAKHGDGPTRAITNIHPAGHYVDPATAARESDPQSQRFHDDATTQSTKTYFTGHGKHEEENG
jgi:hypothetical protein